MASNAATNQADHAGVGPVASASGVIYAHTLQGQPPERWETLEVHSAAVAKLAREFAAAFGAGDWSNIFDRYDDRTKAALPNRMSFNAGRDERWL
jgi:hypothetical protein